MSDVVLCDRRNDVAVVTLNRPDKRNALSREVIARMGELGRKLVFDESLRLVIVTGAGDKAFCAGADLAERATMCDDEVRAQLASYRTELAWLADPRLPSLALINGVALGGGLELALTCDFRIAHESAVLGLVETSLGVIPGAGGTQRLPRLVGEAKAKELVLLSRKLSAQEASNIGLLSSVASGPHGELLARALEWAAPLLSAAPLATRSALAAIQAAADLPLDQGLERELVEYERCLTSEDRLEALRAFREKRPPVFRGK
jgi:enoyl-CoA hydratase/carnithine racemase